jgi:hypothetical protein
LRLLFLALIQDAEEKIQVSSGTYCIAPAQLTAA